MIKHEKVIDTYYKISLGSSNREMGKNLNDLLRCAEWTEMTQEDYDGIHVVLRDFEGDFEGIKIFSCDKSILLIKSICKKLDIDYETIKDIDIKIVT